MYKKIIIGRRVLKSGRQLINCSHFKSIVSKHIYNNILRLRWPDKRSNRRGYGDAPFRQPFAGFYYTYSVFPLGEI